MATTSAQDPILLPIPLSHVSQLIESKPEAFLVGDEVTRAAALEATKYVFNLSLLREKKARPAIAQLLRSIWSSTAPETRSQRKSPSSPSPQPLTDEEVWRPTPLESLHLDGMDDGQVWAQLELRNAALCDTLVAVLNEDVREGDNDQDSDIEMELEDLGDPETYEALDDDFTDSERTEDTEEDVKEGEDLGEEVMDLQDPSDGESSGDEMNLDLAGPASPSMHKTRDGAFTGKHGYGHPVLDDGFFSLADFNAEIIELEAKMVSGGHLDVNDEEEDENAEDDVDIFAPIDEVGADTFEEDDLEVGGQPYYKDFFDPPSRRSSSTRKSNNEDMFLKKRDKTSRVRFHNEVRVKKIKNCGKGGSLASLQSGIIWEDEDDEDEDGLGSVEELNEDHDENEGDLLDLSEQETLGSLASRDTIERFKNDIFAEDEAAPPQDLSTHETRQAAIIAQIRELEAKNVAPKEWTLIGEVTSRTRPINSLLEEDLEFERAMKVVPVVTEERVGSIEEIIKRRILDNHFDDVIRKRRTSDQAFLPSQFFELESKKSTQSLAQIYEDEYSAAVSGKAGADDRDGKLEKEHNELEKMWEGICHKLDALSNAHFTPKQPKVTISTLTNLPTTTLESALPTTKSATTMLAPEEIFAAPLDLHSRDELTPTEKRAQRNKQRKARKKIKDRLAAGAGKSTHLHRTKGPGGAAEKEKLFNKVVKPGKGVTVVGKKSTHLLKRGAERKGPAPEDVKKFKL